MAPPSPHSPSCIKEPKSWFSTHLFPFFFSHYPLCLFHLLLPHTPPSLSLLVFLLVLPDWLSLVRWMCAFPRQMALLLLCVPGSHSDTRPLVWPDRPLPGERTLIWHHSANACCAANQPHGHSHLCAHKHKWTDCVPNSQMETFLLGGTQGIYIVWLTLLLLWNTLKKDKWCNRETAEDFRNV